MVLELAGLARSHPSMVPLFFSSGDWGGNVGLSCLKWRLAQLTRVILKEISHITLEGSGLLFRGILRAHARGSGGKTPGEKYCTLSDF